MLKRKVFLALSCLTIAVACTTSGCGVPREDYDEINSELASAQAEVEMLQDEVTTKSASLAQQQSTNADLQEQISGLDADLSEVLDTYITHYYVFDYAWDTYYCQLEMSLRDYFDYKEKPRATSFPEYPSMATDPDDDILINSVVASLDRLTAVKDLSVLQKVNLIAAFIQSLAHTEDVVTTPYDEYPCYPVETLFKRGGDCIDNSILAAAFLVAMDYDVVLLFFEEQRHVAVGVNVPSQADPYWGTYWGTYWEYEGKRYFYLETTGEGWQIGHVPPQYLQAEAYIYPVNGYPQ